MFATFAMFLFGVLAGSLLNLLADRLTAGWVESPYFNCKSCGRRSSDWEIIPLVGYAIRGGRCPQCGRTVSPARPVVELAAGMLAAAFYLRYGLSPQWSALVAYSFFFLIIAVVDLEYKLILNRLVYPAIPLVFLLALFHPLGLTANESAVDRIISSLAGGAVAFACLMIPALVNERGMGWGDVKLAGLIGVATGFPGVLVALGLAIVAAGVLAIVLLFTRFKKLRDSFAFGPFLSAGAMATLVWGAPLADRWLALVR